MNPLSSGITRGAGPVGLFMLLLSCFLFSCATPHREEGEDDTLRLPPSDLTLDAERWADSVARTMSVREKIGQMLMPAVYSSSDPATIKLLKRYVDDSCIGGIILLKGTLEGAQTLSDTLASVSKVIPFVSIDAEWGLGMRLAGTPVFPDNGRIGKGVDEQTMYDYGNEVARECRLAGVNMLLGPVADVSGSSGSSLSFRSFGSDPGRVASMVAAYARGVEDGNVISVAKHFPGLGSPSGDTHKALQVVRRSRSEMDSVDLPPFRRYIEYGLSGIMAGHMAAPAFGDSLVPASFSRRILSGLLRGEMGFKGLVLTDALNMGGAKGYDAADAVAAGADIVLAPADTREAFLDLRDALETGRITEQILDDRVRRILFFKYLVGIGEIGGESPRNSLMEISTPAADSIRRKLAGQSLPSSL